MPLITPVRSLATLSTKYLTIAAAALSMASAANAQSFNVDLDVTIAFGNPTSLGAPSATFPGAAGQAGFWNACDTTITSPISLNDLANTLTPATLTMSTNAPNGFAHWAFNNPSNTGDYDKLLNDCHIVNNNPGPWSNTYVFNGLQPGTYQVYTHGVRPLTGVSATRVDLIGGSGPQIVAGPMPGNAFALGVTHCIDTVTITGGSLTVVVDRAPSATQAGAFINGFQLVHNVPAPGAALLAMGGLVVMRRRR